MNISFKVPSSKSLVNRYLILKQGYEDFDFNWESEAKDVLLLQKSLNNLSGPIDVGQGGTTFRFLCLYLSTLKGSWKIKMSKSLSKRPHEELYQCLSALGSSIVKESDELITIHSKGWFNQKIEVDAFKTTQVLSGLVLAALAAKKSLEISLNSLGANSGYLKLTQDFIKSLGFKADFSKNKIFVHKNQAPLYAKGFIEGDWSSAAFLYVLGSLKGKAELFNLSEDSIQPDAVILSILQSSGVKVDGLKVSKNNIDKPYRPISVNLQNNPDLFPVLCAFACFCEGESHFYGAPQLKFKESDRILEMKSLLEKCGYKVVALEDGIKIQGRGVSITPQSAFDFDVSKDHRIFMACEILKQMGYKINTIGNLSIEKSFPEYLKMGLN